MTVDASDDIRFMREALKLAAEAAGAGEVPVGAVATAGGEIVASGRNRVEEKCSVGAHAEFEVLHQLEHLSGDWRMSDYTIYVTKEPCPMCAGMLVNARIGRIVYGISDPSGGGCGGALDITGAPGVLWHPEVTGGVMADEAAHLLRDFFRSARQRSKEAK